MQSGRIKSTAAGQVDVGHALNRVVASNLHRFSCYDVVAYNVVASLFSLHSPLLPLNTIVQCVAFSNCVTYTLGGGFFAECCVASSEVQGR